MSAKKQSFDLVRKPVKPAVRKSAPKRAPSSPAPRPRKSLKERRQAARNAAGVFFIVLIVMIAGAIIYGFWRPEVRVTSVHTSGFPDGAQAEQVARATMEGAYAGIFPRDSIFLYPEKEIRSALMDAFPSLSSVSISRNSFSALSFSGTRREVAFYWCGESAASFSVSLSSCHEADAEGIVFAPAPAALEPQGTSTEVSALPERLRIYAPVDTASSTSYPLRARVMGFEHLPNLLRFISAVRTLGIPVLSTSIIGDEAELFVTPETRIKYVLGREAEAALAAEATFPTLNLLDGSIEYVDLRFLGKAYVKKSEE